MRGATIYFAPALLSGRKIKRLIEENNITAIIGSPTIYQEILNTEANLSRCRLLLSAGSKLSTSLFDAFYSKFGKEINNMYGSSETGAIATLYNHARFDGDSSNCGKPMNTINVKCNGTKEIVDTIYIKSNSIAEGVIKNNHLHSLLNEDGWYETNDMGYFDEEGCLHLSCRRNEVINIGGEKISPKAIEAIFEKYYGEAVAISETDDNGFDFPVVYVEANNFVSIHVKDELERMLSKRFLPKKVYVVKKFPRNSNGKIKRNELINVEKEAYDL